MNGVHDMGGMQCYGAVDVSESDELFHAAWEKRVLGITVAMGATGVWNLDESRYARESLPPAFYLSASYYEIWLTALCNLLVKHGLVTMDELTRGEVSVPAKRLLPVLQSEAVPRALAAGAPVDRAPQDTQKFQVGDNVRVANRHTATHTRLPSYIRNKIGVVKAVHGCHVYPDSNAQGLGENPEWLYNIQFDTTASTASTARRACRLLATLFK